MKDKMQQSENSSKKIIHLKKSTGTSIVFDWAHSLVFALITVLIILTFFVRLVDVDGQSMMNTLLDGDRVIVTNFFYEPDNGDVVVISHGQDYDQPIIKRVIATEGQTLSIDFETDTIKVDGKVVDEYYSIGDTTQKDAEIPDVVPEGKIFVLGDNRTVSADSLDNRIGLIDKNAVIGKAQFVLFPFNRIKMID